MLPSVSSPHYAEHCVSLRQVGSTDLTCRGEATSRPYEVTAAWCETRIEGSEFDRSFQSIKAITNLSNDAIPIGRRVIWHQGNMAPHQHVLNSSPEHAVRNVDMELPSLREQIHLDLYYFDSSPTWNLITHQRDVPTASLRRRSPRNSRILLFTRPASSPISC